MPSRINIGPENGPYVAINESSGNLQLEDNTGNVVAEWDETNAQWDFANNTLNNVDALYSNSVNTEEVNTDQWADLGDGVDSLNNVLESVGNADGGLVEAFGEVIGFDDRVRIESDSTALSGRGQATVISQDPNTADDNLRAVHPNGDEDDRIRYIQLANLYVELSRRNIDCEWVERSLLQGLFLGPTADGEPNADGIEIDDSRYLILSQLIGWQHGQDTVHVSNNNQHVLVSDSISIEAGQEEDRFGGFSVSGAPNSEFNSFVNVHSIDSRNEAAEVIGGRGNRYVSLTAENPNRGVFLNEGQYTQIGLSSVYNSSSFGIGETSSSESEHSQITGTVVENASAQSYNLHNPAYLSNFMVVGGATDGIRTRADGSVLNTGYVEGPDGDGIVVLGTTTLLGVTVDGDNTTTRGISIEEDNCLVQGTQVRNCGGPGYRLRNCEGVRLVGVLGENNGNDDFIIEDTAIETVVRGASVESISDSGTRTLINGRGTNSGDPSTEGEWNGHDDFAEETDATIHDETNDNLYKAADGSWIQIG